MANSEPWRQHYDNALAAMLAGNEADRAISEFENALAAGLPSVEEPRARLRIGAESSRLALRKRLRAPEMIETPEWQRAESEMTAALRVDREGGHGAFADRNGRSMLNDFDLVCHVGAGARAEQSPQVAIAFIESMVGLSDYLSSSPLRYSLFRLGHLYLKAGDKQKAIEAWQRVIAAEPVDYVDASGEEAKVRKDAEENIAFLQGTTDASTTDKQSGKGCLVLATVLSLGAALLVMVGRP